MAFIYGHWGKGIYWDVLEILRDQPDYTFKNDDESLRLLSDLIGCKDESKFINWFKDCVRIGIIKNEEKYFFCPEFTENMMYWDKKRTSASIGGTKSSEIKSSKRSSITSSKHSSKTQVITEQTEQNNKKKYKKKNLSSKELREVLFKDSAVFDPEVFRGSIPEWSEAKCKYYYESVRDWSEEGGKKKIDWIRTAKTWERNDVKNGKPFKEPAPQKFKSPLDQFNSVMTS